MECDQATPRHASECCPDDASPSSAPSSAFRPKRRRSRGHQDPLSTRSVDRPRARWGLLNTNLWRNNSGTYASDSTNNSNNNKDRQIYHVDHNHNEEEEEELRSESGRSGRSGFSIKSTASIRSTLSLSGIGRRLRKRTPLFARHLGRHASSADQQSQSQLRHNRNYDQHRSIRQVDNNANSNQHQINRHPSTPSPYSEHRQAHEQQSWPSPAEQQSQEERADDHPVRKSMSSTLLRRMRGRRRQRTVVNVSPAADAQVAFPHLPPSPSVEARLVEVEEVLQDQISQSQDQQHNKNSNSNSVREAVAQCVKENLRVREEQEQVVLGVGQCARQAWRRVCVDVCLLMSLLGASACVAYAAKDNANVQVLRVQWHQVVPKSVTALIESSVAVAVAGIEVIAPPGREIGLLVAVGALMAVWVLYRYIQLRQSITVVRNTTQNNLLAHHDRQSNPQGNDTKRRTNGVAPVLRGRSTLSSSRLDALRPTQIDTALLPDATAGAIESSTAHESTPPASMSLVGVRIVSDASMCIPTTPATTTATASVSPPFALAGTPVSTPSNSDHVMRGSTNARLPHSKPLAGSAGTVSTDMRTEIFDPETLETFVLTDDQGIYVTREQLEHIRAVRVLVSEKTKALEEDIRRRHPHLLPTPAHTLASEFPEIVGDVRLLRFVIGHKTVRVAAQFVNDMLQWRIDCDVAQYHASVRKIVQQRSMASIPHASEVVPYMPCNFFAGETAHGDWVGWENTGLIDGKKLVLQVGQHKVLEFSLVQIEAKNILFDRNTRAKAIRYSDGTEPLLRCVDEVLCKGILYKDLSGLGRQHAWPPGLKLIKEVARVAQSFYPEILRTCFIVNTPLVFFAIWKVVSLFFNKETLDRVKIFRSTDTSWQQQLQNLSGHSLQDLGIIH